MKDNENFISARCALHDEFIKDIRESQTRIETIILGNGHPEDGIVMRTKMIENSIEEIKDLLKQQAEKREWLARTAIVGGFTGVVSLLVALGKFFIGG